jgi:hypothetical protein
VGYPGVSATQLIAVGEKMSYHVTHWTGADSVLPLERFPELLDELSNADDEHPDVTVTHETEWSLAVYKSGFVVLENLEQGGPAHMGPIDRPTTLSLMVAVAEGRIDDVQSASWKPGYPPKQTT